MGRAGPVVNVIALLFLTWVWVFCFFPVSKAFEASKFNWNVVINGGVMIFAVLYYYFFAKKQYFGPVALVKSES
jgi:hypothetical protein